MADPAPAVNDRCTEPKTCDMRLDFEPIEVRLPELGYAALAQPC